MIRIELFANQSLQDMIINNLEGVIPDFFYSVVPLSHGRGKDSYKLGTATWPETNFILIAYCDDSQEQAVRTVIQYVKSKFPDEGVKLFILHEQQP